MQFTAWGQQRRLTESVRRIAIERAGLDRQVDHAFGPVGREVHCGGAARGLRAGRFARLQHDHISVARQIVGGAEACDPSADDQDVSGLSHQFGPSNGADVLFVLLGDLACQVANLKRMLANLTNRCDFGSGAG